MALCVALPPFSPYLRTSRTVSELSTGRRRKIKCIFHPDRQNVCNECFGRGIQCIVEESAADVQTDETRQSLRERVAQLESLVRNISQKMDLDDTSSTGSAVPDPAKHKAALPDLVAAASGNEHAPIMTLFNNGLISGQMDDESPQPVPASAVPPRIAASAQCGTTANEERIRRKLLAVVPSNKDIDSIFAHTSQWQNIWRYVDSSAVPASMAGALTGTGTSSRKSIQSTQALFPTMSNGPLSLVPSLLFAKLSFYSPLACNSCRRPSSTAS